jgi:hypothetical protein
VTAASNGYVICEKEYKNFEEIGNDLNKAWISA